MFVQQRRRKELGPPECHPLAPSLLFTPSSPAFLAPGHYSAQRCPVSRSERGSECLNNWRVCVCVWGDEGHTQQKNENLIIIFFAQLKYQKKACFWKRDKCMWTRWDQHSLCFAQICGAPCMFKFILQSTFLLKYMMRSVLNEKTVQCVILATPCSCAASALATATCRVQLSLKKQRQYDPR